MFDKKVSWSKWWLATCFSNTTACYLFYSTSAWTTHTTSHPTHTTRYMTHQQNKKNLQTHNHTTTTWLPAFRHLHTLPVSVLVRLSQQPRHLHAAYCSQRIRLTTKALQQHQRTRYAHNKSRLGLWRPGLKP